MVSAILLKMAEGRKRKNVYGVYDRKRKATEYRNKTRVILGEYFTRWLVLKAQVGLPTDGSREDSKVCHAIWRNPFKITASKS